MTIEIISGSDHSEIKIIANLAREIWSQHFTPIIGRPQVEYMLDKFQSLEAVSSQIDSGWKYYLARLDNEAVGYVGIVVENNDNKMMLSKLYVRQSARGSGVGKSLLEFIEQKCNQDNLSSIWLTVNRNNDDTITWYKRRGFTIVDEVKKDIGGGFYMDDYIMEKAINPL